MWKVVNRRGLFRCQLLRAAGVDRAANGACKPYQVVLSVQPSIHALKAKVDVIEVVFQESVNNCIVQDFFLKRIANICCLEDLKPI
jgi:hypothetical protein